MWLRHQRDRLLAQSKDRQNGAVEAHMCITDPEQTHVRGRARHNTCVHKYMQIMRTD